MSVGSTGKMPVLLMGIARHQFPLRQNMTAHGGIEFGAARARFQLQFGIEREDFEKITMRSGGRTGTAVIVFAKIVRALDRTSGCTVLGNSCRFRIDVPGDPMRK